MTPAWTLSAWPAQLWQAQLTASLHFFHLDTRVLNPGDKMFPSTGQTVWVGLLEHGEAGMAWDWVQLSRGIVAMADPMSVVTNLRLVGPKGDVLTSLEAARHLNEIVHMLPWQSEVRRALSGAHA